MKNQEAHIEESSLKNICNSIDNNDLFTNKMLSDRLLLESFNVIENNKQKNFCDNNISLLYFDKSSSGTASSNSASVLHNNENQMELDGLNLNNNCNSSSSSTTNLTNSNCVKRERLSPSTNGELPSISR